MAGSKEADYLRELELLTFYDFRIIVEDGVREDEQLDRGKTTEQILFTFEENLSIEEIHKEHLNSLQVIEVFVKELNRGIKGRLFLMTIDSVD